MFLNFTLLTTRPVILQIIIQSISGKLLFWRYCLAWQNTTQRELIIMYEVNIACVCLYVHPDWFSSFPVGQCSCMTSGKDLSSSFHDVRSSVSLTQTITLTDWHTLMKVRAWDDFIFVTNFTVTMSILLAVLANNKASFNESFKQYAIFFFFLLNNKVIMQLHHWKLIK